MLINGNDIANGMLEALRTKAIPQKKLVVIHIGDDSASKSFVAKKKNIAQSLGVHVEVREVSPVEQEISNAIESLNDDETVGGIVVQLPLPESVSRDRIVALIRPEKDVDALTAKARVLAPTVIAVQHIFSALHMDHRAMRIAVIGKGFLVGKPIAAWLKASGQNVSHMDYGAIDVETLKDADIVITGTGKPAFLKCDSIKKGVVLIDFGYAKNGGKTFGDVDVESCSAVASFITPTPGGTGPIVVAALMQNFFELAS
ncbi:MAG: bifunctional 5,10-methylenetetrahydrofolate dehydrogenase/5,10-methenyltetrahydrofolate cyclohydrolase [Patescibacteria group bacterium]